MSDANHEIGKKCCSRYGCCRVSEIDTEMGGMCSEHAAPLMFQIQTPYEFRRPHEDFFLPWEFVRPHDRRAQINHGGQTLARLSERGGLSFDEVLAVLLDRPWSHVDYLVARDRVMQMLAEWRSIAGSAPFNILCP